MCHLTIPGHLGVHPLGPLGYSGCGVILTSCGQQHPGRYSPDTMPHLPTPGRPVLTARVSNVADLPWGQSHLQTTLASERKRAARARGARGCPRGQEVALPPSGHPDPRSQATEACPESAADRTDEQTLSWLWKPESLLPPREAWER